MMPAFNPGQGVPQGLSVKAAVEQKSRVPRRPQHRHFVSHHPYVLQPFMIAPVLPGETLKSLKMQCRCVTDPIKSRLVGWWLEHYYFYVPLTAFLESVAPGIDEDTGSLTGGGLSSMQTMLMDISSPLTGTGDAVISPPYSYTATDGYNFIEKCLFTVVDGFFRDADEGVLQNFADGLQPDMPIAKLRCNDVTQSLFKASEIPAPASGVVLTDATIDPAELTELDTVYQTWLLLTQKGLIKKTYEQYLADFGVRTPEALPMASLELIRVSNEWQYPSNTVEPTTGVPSSAVSWSVQLSADKDRFIREPGFIFGVTCARPKSYRSYQAGSISSYLTTALDWMPAALKEKVHLSMKTFAATTGPYASVFPTSSYTVDMRDLFTHGDQYLSDIGSTARANALSIQDETDPLHYAHTYPVFAGATGVEGLFAGVTDATRLVHQDGMTSLHILGTQLDHTV